MLWPLIETTASIRVAVYLAYQLRLNGTSEEWAIAPSMFRLGQQSASGPWAFLWWLVTRRTTQSTNSIKSMFCRCLVVKLHRAATVLGTSLSTAGRFKSFFSPVSISCPFFFVVYRFISVFVLFSAWQEAGRKKQEACKAPTHRTELYTSPRSQKICEVWLYVCLSDRASVRMFSVCVCSPSQHT